MPLTPKQVAARLGVSAKLVYGWVGRGEIAHLRLGARKGRGKILVTEEQLQSFLEGRAVAAAPAAPPPKPRGAAAFKHLTFR